MALVCMPFFSASRPSIQLGLLQAITRAHGFPCDTFHFNVELARSMGVESYEALCNLRGRRLTGEWLFGPAAFGDEVAADEAPYLEAFPDEVAKLLADLDAEPQRLTDLRHDVLPRFIEECAESVDWARYGVVGFTSTFQQNVASMALARRIRERHDDVIVVFGGANYEDEMGPAYLSAVPWIDFAVVGEADHTFPAFLKAVGAGMEPTGVPGVAANTAEGVKSHKQAAPIEDLDDLPIPNFDEYFDRAQSLSVPTRLPYPVGLPFESSRGCWWGQKHHCTFCGLNGNGMTYRSKSPDRVIAELTAHAQRYGRTVFESVDNILDMSYLSGLFGELSDAGADFEIFYEVKSQLTRSQLAGLHRGGMRTVQPGIESLSTHVLGLMRKGTTMLKNIRLMKWAAYYGISVMWNVLWGFPGESDDDYREQARVMQLLSHLEAPQGCGPIRLERFSPYFKERDTFPITNIRPDPAYAHCYPASLDLDRAAYFFEYDMSDIASESAVSEVAEQVATWQENWHSEERDSFTFRRIPTGIYIDDRRTTGTGGRIGTHSFEGALAEIYLACTDTMRTAEAVVERLEKWAIEQTVDGVDAEAPTIADTIWALDEFCARGLMVSENGQYLALALPLNGYWGRE